MPKMKVVIKNCPESCAKCFLLDRVCDARDSFNLESGRHPQCPMVPDSKPSELEYISNKIDDILNEFAEIEYNISGYKNILKEIQSDAKACIELGNQVQQWERKIFDLEAKNNVEGKGNAKI